MSGEDIDDAAEDVTTAIQSFMDRPEWPDAKAEAVLAAIDEEVLDQFLKLFVDFK